MDRILGMVEGAILLVDANEGPLSQTKFVVEKALRRGLRPLVVLNKANSRHPPLSNQMTYYCTGMTLLAPECFEPSGSSWGTDRCLHPSFCLQTAGLLTTRCTLRTLSCVGFVFLVCVHERDRALPARDRLDHASEYGSGQVDRPSTTKVRCGEVESAIFDLFAQLGASDEQLDFPIFYASAREVCPPPLPFPPPPHGAAC